jgi:hypothetical protein
MAKLKCNYQKEKLIHILGSYPENAFVKLNFLLRRGSYPEFFLFIGIFF